MRRAIARSYSSRDIEKAKKLLSHPSFEGKVGKDLLLKKLAEDPEKALKLILGEKTPAGNDTIEAKIKRLGKKKRKRKVKRAKTLEVGKPPKGVRIYDGSDTPEGPDFEILYLDKEGGDEMDSSLVTHHPIKYPALNPIQTIVYPFSQKDCNLVVAASTSAGKTITAELVMADAIHRGGKAVFLSPLKAVSQEKYNDWTEDEDHPWYGKNVEILTGDYQLGPSKKKALEKADIIVMTSEMLDSKTRNLIRDESEWLLKVLVMVVDEAHLLTMQGRGDALECGLMRFTSQNPFARVVLLSATMPNVDELGQWLQLLNGKKTRVVESEWRPTQLRTHWINYPYKGGFRAYHENEDTKRSAGIEVLKQFPDDKWIIFVHSKKAGRQLAEAMTKQGLGVEFHNGELDKNRRDKIERGFRDGDLQYVIATSTLAYGINMPARRVLILGLRRGIDLVDPIDVKQMIGRAGRVGFDERGDAYVLIPHNQRRPSESEDLRRKFSEIGRIVSTITTPDNLAFHLTAEIAINNVKTQEDASAWHKRSLAHFQGLILEDMDEEEECSAESVLERLVECNILDEVGEENYKVTMLGRVASWLYFSPFDISDWAKNFRRLEYLGKQKDPTCLAWALGSINTRYKGWIPGDLKKASAEFIMELKSKGIEIKTTNTDCIAYEYAIRGYNHKSVKHVIRGLRHDSDRVLQALKLIDNFYLKLYSPEYFERLRARVSYGCSWEEASLCSLPNVGAKRAEALMEGGVTSLEDVTRKKGRVRSILGEKISGAVIRKAVELLGERQ